MSVKVKHTQRRSRYAIHASGLGGMFGCWSFVVCEVEAQSEDEALNYARYYRAFKRAKAEHPNANFYAHVSGGAS